VRVAEAGGVPTDLAFDPTAMVLVGDPYSVSVPDMLGAVAFAHPDLPVVGGMASGARGPGGSRLALDGSVYTDGAVGALLGPGADVVSIVSQGCRPVGRPFVVTDGGGGIIRELAGKPALVRLDEIAGGLAPDEIRAINEGGLHLGRVVDERKAEFGPGDFLVRQVLGGDRESGAIAVNDQVEVGTTVQFHVRDAAAAHAELDAMLSAGDEVDAALLFSCNGRGARLFGIPDHDAGLLSKRVGPVPTAGFFAAGELGPVAGHNELHSYTASMLLLRERGYHLP
jgi:small ligand-binding sensory domain FIST